MLSESCVWETPDSFYYAGICEPTTYIKYLCNIAAAHVVKQKFTLNLKLYELI